MILYIILGVIGYIVLGMVTIGVLYAIETLETNAELILCGLFFPLAWILMFFVFLYNIPINIVDKIKGKRKK